MSRSSLRSRCLDRALAPSAALALAVVSCTGTGGDATGGPAPAGGETAAAGGETAAAESGPAPGAYRGSLLTPAPRPDFTLDDVDGRPFDFRTETTNQLALLFFGYTSCPDVCPVHMAGIAAVLRDLPWEVRDRIRVVFVTTDPERDTPERLRGWLGGFDPSFVGLRGGMEEVNRIQTDLGLPASVRLASPADSGPGYDVGHAAQVLVFGGDDLRLAYPFGTRQADWKRDLPRLVAGLAP